MGVLSLLASVFAGTWSLMSSSIRIMLDGLIGIYGLIYNATSSHLLAAALTAAVLALVVAAVYLSIRLAKTFVMLVIVLLALAAIVVFLL